MSKQLKLNADVLHFNLSLNWRLQKVLKKILTVTHDSRPAVPQRQILPKMMPLMPQWIVKGGLQIHSCPKFGLQTYICPKFGLLTHICPNPYMSQSHICLKPIFVSNPYLFLKQQWFLPFIRPYRKLSYVRGKPDSHLKILNPIIIV